MAIHQTQKQSDLEKRLKLLRQQVYGKEFRFSSSDSTNNEQRATNPISDTAYLYQDLIKIGILSSLALGIEIVLYFSNLF